VADRVSVTAGLGYAHIEGYASRYSPRLSLAAYLRKPTPNEFWSDTRLTFNAGKGIKAPSIYQELNSLLPLLPPAQATALGVGPVGPERGRNLDIGIEQDCGTGARARVPTSTTSSTISSNSCRGRCCRSSEFRRTWRWPQALART
jgi:iron complex outermembrane receptor protein/vitamin B12 transporter